MTPEGEDAGRVANAAKNTKSREATEWHPSSRGFLEKDSCGDRGGQRKVKRSRMTNRLNRQTTKRKKGGESSAVALRLASLSRGNAGSASRKSTKPRLGGTSRSYRPKGAAGGGKRRPKKSKERGDGSHHREKKRRKKVRCCKQRSGLLEGEWRESGNPGR